MKANELVVSYSLRYDSFQLFHVNKRHKRQCLETSLQQTQCRKLVTFHCRAYHCVHCFYSLIQFLLVIEILRVQGEEAKLSAVVVEVILSLLFG